MEKSHTQMLISEQEKEKAKFVFLKGMISKKPLMWGTVLKLWASVSKSPNQQMMVPVVVAVAEVVVVVVVAEVAVADVAVVVVVALVVVVVVVLVVLVLVVVVARICDASCRPEASSRVAPFSAGSPGHRLRSTGSGVLASPNLVP
jgi:hypothetical protein